MPSRSRLIALGVATLVALALYASLRWLLGHPWWTLLAVGLALGVGWRLASELQLLGPLVEGWHQRATDWLRSNVWRSG